MINLNLSDILRPWRIAPLTFIVISAHVPAGVAPGANTDVIIDVSGTALQGINIGSKLAVLNTDVLAWPVNGAPVMVTCSATGPNEVTATFLNIGAFTTADGMVDVTIGRLS